jgi:uncharacterized protein YcbK (DUF882 family)
MPKKKNKGKGHKNKPKPRSTWGCPNCAQPNPLSQPNCSMCGERKEQPNPTTNTSTSASSTTTPPRNYQQEALQKYNEMHSELQRLTGSHPNPASDPMLGQVVNKYKEALAIYKKESDRPDKDRNIPPPGMSMPRQVLRVISGYRSMTQIYRMNNEQLPSIPKDPGYVVLRLIKYVDESSSPLETGFGICLMNNTEISKQIQM